MLDYEAVLAWLAIGAIAGWLAGLIVEGFGLGLLGNIVVGMIGAAIAGLAAPMLGLDIETKLGGTLAATAGAVGVLLALHLFHRD